MPSTTYFEMTEEAYAAGEKPSSNRPRPSVVTYDHNDAVEQEVLRVM